MNNILDILLIKLLIFPSLYGNVAELQPVFHVFVNWSRGEGGQ